MQSKGIGSRHKGDAPAVPPWVPGRRPVRQPDAQQLACQPAMRQLWDTTMLHVKAVL
jgi:hypothetical protein